MATRLQRKGWDILAWNFRGCGPEPNRLVRSYHSGETGDLGAVIALAAERYPRIALIGFSLGGNVTLKYLGEGGCHPAVVAGIAISVPIDLAASAHAIDHRWSNRIYLRRFLGRLLPKIRAKALLFPDRLDVRRNRRIRTFRRGRTATRTRRSYRGNVTGRNRTSAYSRVASETGMTDKIARPVVRR